ncbi:MAG: cupin domain-containing protein [Planctomycetes bacterium]|nr:cupin domain-containing protein [Planctomycetota bacterium]
MAILTVPDQGRRLDDPREIAAYLKPYGITYERWTADGRVDPDASPEAVLAAYAPEVERLQRAGGYRTADVMQVRPDTPGLEAMLAKFNKEHTHSEDEVRFVVKGRGVFHIRPETGPVFALEMDAGDLINVPAGTRHWFDLCGDRTIRAIRLFQDAVGWTPYYVKDGVHDRYTPVCWGPAFLPGVGPRRGPQAAPPGSSPPPTAP